MAKFLCIALALCAVASASPVNITLPTDLGAVSEPAALSSAGVELQDSTSESVSVPTAETPLRRELLGLRNVVDKLLVENRGQGNMADVAEFVGSAGRACREVFGWATGTIIGLASGAASGIGKGSASLVKGLTDGFQKGNPIGGILDGFNGGLRGLAEGVTSGAGSSF